MNKNLSLALVALEEEQAPNKLLLDFLGTMWTDLPKIHELRERESAMTMCLGEAVCGITLVDRKIPWAQIEGPCEAAWYWPEATETLRGHESHWLLTLLDETSGAIDRNMRLTQITAAAAATSPSLGICWGAASLIHEPRPFLDLAQTMTRDLLPLNLWIDFRIEPQAEGLWRLYTTGLESLGFREIEVLDYPVSETQEGEVQAAVQELRDRVYNVAHYQIDSASPIKDGDTLGLTDSEQWVAKLTGSMWDAEKEVVRLTF